jgi:hypothetical protein
MQADGIDAGTGRNMHVVARGAAAAGALALATLTPLWLASAGRDTRGETAARYAGIGISAALGATAAALLVPSSASAPVRAALVGVSALGMGIAGSRLGATKPDRAPLEPWGPGNGCGEGWWTRAIPDLGFSQACDEHDRYYLRGTEADGHPATRERADSRMLEVGVAEVEARYGPLDPRRYAGITAASTYYGVVRAVGAPWWDAPSAGSEQLR